MKRIIRVFLIHLLMLSSINLYAKDEKSILIIGTKVAPPFAMKDKSGEWKGVSIDLWKEIAKKLDLNYKFQEETLNSLMDKIKNRKIEIGVAAITASAKRERFADFSNGYYTEELSIAIPKNEGSIFNTLWKKLFSYTTLWVILGLIIVIHVAGVAFWLMERDDGNSENGINDLNKGIWWAATTMTTVGYGDVTPKTFGGKVVAIIWMFISMFLVAILIAVFASIFTTTEKRYFISSPSDLNKGTIATVAGSFSDDYLQKKGIIPVYYSNLQDALKAVKHKEVDAVVYDEQLLKYIINKDFKDSLKLSGAHFLPQNYSFIFKNNCKYKEMINRALLDIVESDKWDIIKNRYSVR